MSQLSNDDAEASPGFGRAGVSINRPSGTFSGQLDPLVTSKLGNSQPPPVEDNNTPAYKKQKLEHFNISSSFSQTSDLEKILAKLSPKQQPSDACATNQEILTRLSQQQAMLKKQHTLLASNHTLSSIHPTTDSLSSLLAIAPGTEPVSIQPWADSDEREASNIEDPSEITRLKQELLAANSKIALQEQELAQTRVIKHTLDQALGPPSEVDFGGRDVTEQTLSNLQNAFNASNQSFGHFQGSWNTQEDARSDLSDALSAGTFNKARGVWMPPSQPVFGATTDSLATDKTGIGFDHVSGPSRSLGQELNGFWAQSVNSEVQGGSPFQLHKVLPGPSVTSSRQELRYPGDQSRFFSGTTGITHQTVIQGPRQGSCFPTHPSTWGAFPTGLLGNSVHTSPTSPTNRRLSPFQSVGMYQMPPYQPRPVGTPLSPTASEFTSNNANVSAWANLVAPVDPIQTYVSPLEPLNYRRLLDKNVSCDWKYIVDKIVCNNDQQASIFLQQKLKVGTVEQRYDIVEAIVNQAYPLMINRFGNFLVQRCFEHGTPEQVIAIASAIRGNTLSLSMDPFGCHVIQKAFDCVPEEQKAAMVHELLRRIPETVIHRYACHVWQKLFELRWSGEPPQIMAKVNEALRGMWHEVALGETGSLVVQNIFENCVEDEKRPAIEEVLTKIDVLAHGQFGNWCIQHICEHGAPHDKSRAIEHILLWAVDYSMDQFASKIVEKCLKIGGTDFLDRYLSRVCMGRSDRPRMPLIDIAGDQYGNYLIQWVLMNAASHQRELVATHIRKHMVSLRGSKFGSRVAMLCCIQVHNNRTGPSSGFPIGRFNNFNDDRFQAPPGSRFNRSNQWNPNYPPFR
ncbi:hypothetical protein ASPZODRAFT_160396 [Penicilliopsis zonata CBS 506.65]|uniref:PUM-HD domain-containing protein n=1 Tax=Penicilliopsis zonata CBS 506.65 TaxID=1073090 RepID=A0A1L9SCK4_9EURO|nr:hypothetical protein ASPZODRAFT_160396 [Penicilliopsis zonata CBS 506.65]OJJ44848.1 hypothetical protein ASPZODRAFT_160396 [Penicilliopsis zonata CBS 506.65]